MYKLNMVWERVHNYDVNHYFAMGITIDSYFRIDYGIHGFYNLLQMKWYA